MAYGSHTQDSACIIAAASTTIHSTFIVLTTLYLTVHLLLVRFCKRKAPRLYKRYPGHVIRWLIILLLLIVQVFTIAESVLTIVKYGYLTRWDLFVPDILSFLGIIISAVFFHHIETYNNLKLLVFVCAYWTSCVGLRVWGFVSLWTTYADVSGYIRLYFLAGLSLCYATLAVIEIYTFKTKWSRSRHVDVSDDVSDVQYVHNQSSMLSQMTFNWMTGFLAHGYRHALQMEDLGTMPQTENVQRNFLMLKHVFMQEKARCGGDKNAASLWWCMWRAYWPMVALAGLYKLLSDQLLFVAPICVDFMVAYVVGYIADRDKTTYSTNTTANVTIQIAFQPIEIVEFFSNGYVLALITLLSTLLYATLWQNNFYLSSRQGVRCKGALQALAYDKTLRLSTQGMTEGGTTQGQILNHMTVDPLNIFMFFYMGHFAWTLPIQVLVGFALLYMKLGVSALISGLLIVVMVPVQYYIGVCLARVQKQIMIQADDRLKKTNEILQSIKLLKLYAWEQMFTDGVTETRKRELRLLLKAGICRVLSILVCDGAPVTASLITFCLYPYIEKKPLDAGKAFSGLALFAILSIPLFLITVVMNSLSHALVSVRRLRDFLFAQEIEAADDSNHSKPDAPKGKVNGSVSFTRSDAPETEGLLEKVASSTVPAVIVSNGDLADDSLNVQQADMDVLMDDGIAVEVKGGSYAWDASTKQPIVTDLNFKIRRGELAMFVGPVGSGKSSVLSALLGEMTRISGTITWNKKCTIAYVHQNAWIMNATVKDNILFGTPLDRKRYDRVLDACAMTPDLDILIAGDQTEIGEKGVNLSGGQKQRVSLARAVYSGADVVIMDDPLSALDAHVGSHVFNDVILDMLLSEGKTVLLVTHQVQFLPKAHKIFVVSEGKISSQGSYQEITVKVPNLLQTLDKEVERTTSNVKVQESKSQTSNYNELSTTPNTKSSHLLTEKTLEVLSSGMRSACSMTSLSYLGVHDDVIATHKLESQLSQTSKANSDLGKGLELGRLIEEEERSTGSVPLRYYLHYARAASLWLSLGTILFYVARQVIRVATDFWLASWAEASQRAATIDAANAALMQIYSNSSAIPLHENDYDLYYYMKIYSVYIVFSIITCGLGILFLELMVVVAAKNFHAAMLTKVICAPMRFFDTTPIGRIVNRFAGDTNMIDEKMATAWDQVLFCLIFVLGGVVVNAITTPVFIIPALVIFVLYLAVQRFYIASSRELHRLDNVTKSPILAHFSETLGGLTTVRAYRVEKKFQEKNWKFIEDNNAACLFRETAHVWMGIRLDILGACIVFTAGVSSLTSGVYEVISPGIVGLTIAYAVMISSFLNWLIRGVSELEMWFNAVERVVYYSTEVPTETNLTAPDADTHIPADWPRTGDVTFDHVSLRYDLGLPSVIKDLTLHISSGEKVGICGRTGSGKSSLALSLFRMLDIHEGGIHIDGRNTQGIPLPRLRAALSIIPQDPVLFSGTVRYNLDPGDSCTDEEIWKALDISQLKPTIQELPQNLDSAVSEGGQNFSVGQRQLFCLARAFLRHSRILVMDEATASIDLETDEIIQKVIQTAFEDRTVLIIAHRIRTIVNCDKIVVLKDGKVIEHDSPRVLMKDKTSSFSQMLQQNI